MKFLNSIYKSDEDLRIARILLYLIVALLAAYLVLAALGVYWLNIGLVILPLAGCVMFALPLGLLFRGHLRGSSMIVVLTALIMVTVLATIGQGIRDIALITYPGIVVISCLLLQRRDFIAVSVVSLGMMGWLVFGEIFGWYVHAPIPAVISPLDFIIVVIIMGMTLLSSDLLAENMRESLRRAQQQNDAREQAETTLRVSEEKYRNVVENIQDVVFSTNAEGWVNFISPRVRIFGYDPDQFVSKHISKLMGAFSDPRDLPMVKSAFNHKMNLDANDPPPVVFRLVTASGQRKWVEINSRLQRDGSGNLISVTGILRDVTVDAEAERAAKIISEVQLALLQPCELAQIYALASQKVQELVGDCVTGVSLLDETTRTVRSMGYHGLDVSIEKISEIFGKDLLNTSFPIGRMSPNELRIYRSGRLERLEDGLHTILASLAPRPLCAAVEKLLRIRDVYAIGFIHGDEHLGAVVILSRVDITPYQGAIEQIVGLASFAINRKRAETAQHESERRFRETIENVNLLAVGLDAAGNITFCNNFLLQLTGWKKDEIMGKNWFEYFLPERFLRPVQQIFVSAILSGEIPLHYDNEIRCRSGEERLVRWNNTILRDLQGNVTGAISLGEDITERKRAEEKLRAALEEKDALLREVHHRVKNNLQVMIALIKMRVGLTGDADTRQFLKELEEQARTMSLVYEQLYQSDNLAQVNMGTYLQHLTSNLLDGYGIRIPMGRHSGVQVNLDAHLSLDVAHAMPCGLIINELLTNSLKYAFPPGYGGNPSIDISIRQEGDICHLVISDNGIGMPHDYDWNSSKSMGIRLVHLWATHQLGGTLDVSTESGTTFAISFNLKE